VQPHADLAEDVLLALPARGDDTIDDAVSRFATSSSNRVRELALAVVARALDPR
jgi:hypothetical protein